MGNWKEDPKGKEEDVIDTAFIHSLLEMRVKDIVKIEGLNMNEEQLNRQMAKEDEEDQVVYNIRQVFSKDKVEDLFPPERDDENFKNKTDTATDQAKFKFKQRISEQKLKKIKMFLRLGMFKGVLMIKAILVKIQLLKD